MIQYPSGMNPRRNQRRRNTLQGGNGRAATYGGTPNAPAQGITQQYLGGNPVGKMAGGTQNAAMGLFGSGPRPIVGGAGGGGGGIRGVTPIRPPGGKGGGQGAGGGKGGGGGGGNQAGGIGGGFGGGQYANLIKKLDLPLDAFFEAQRTGLVNDRESALNMLTNNYNIGTAQLDQANLLGNRQIDETMAARGLFGSGVEKRDERLLGNDIAMERLGLGQMLQEGQLGAEQDFRTGMMGALQELAARLQGEKYLPLPTRGGKGKGGKGKGGGKGGGGGGKNTGGGGTGGGGRRQNRPRGPRPTDQYGR